MPEGGRFLPSQKNGSFCKVFSADLVSTFKRLLANNFQEHGYRIDGELTVADAFSLNVTSFGLTVI